MTYAKEPLVIKPVREIPQEVMFNVKHAERDKNVPNRLWFKYPENWAHTTEKERIIGIRNIFVAQAERHLKVSWTASVYKKSDPTKKVLLEIPFGVDTFADNRDNFVKLLRYTYQWSQQKIKALQDQCASGTVPTPPTPTPTPGPSPVPPYPEELSVNSLEQASDEEVKAAIKALKPYRMNMFYYDGKPTITLFNDMNTDDRCQYGIVIKTIDINDSDIPKLLIETPTFNEDHTMFTMVMGWDRRPLYLTSNLSDITNDYYLGHSERTYTPLKYYRIHSTDDKFWVDTWSTRDHKAMSILPEDGEDELFIEAIVCFDSSAMI